MFRSAVSASGKIYQRIGSAACPPWQTHWLGALHATICAHFPFECMDITELPSISSMRFSAAVGIKILPIRCRSIHQMVELYYKFIVSYYFLISPIINREDFRSSDLFCFSAHVSEIVSLYFNWSVQGFF